MPDPGRPFAIPYATVIEALEDRIRNGTEQPDHWRFVFQSPVSAYELPRPASVVTSVAGSVDRVYTVFAAGEDYRFAGNRLIWIDAGRRPDDGSRVDVEFSYRERPSGITDLNPGSVIGTLIRAVAREMNVIYQQMDEAYRRAFIDVATGVALENVVALLGISRNPAIRARGEVTYVRRTATDRSVEIPEDSRVTDAGGRTFRTLVRAEILAERDDVVPSGTVLRTTDKVAKVVGVWPRADTPDPATSLATRVTADDQPFGEDERTVTLETAAPPAGELRVRYQPKSVTVAVEAVEPGPEGNVDAGTVTVMPTPPAGVNGVVNERSIEGGRSAEPDDQLRERAKHALERAGNATLNALRFAILDVDGIDEVEVNDHATDRGLPLGEVRVRYSASGDLDRVRADVAAAVEATRAAGTRVIAAMIETLAVSGTFHLVPDVNAPPDAAERFVAAVVAAIGGLTIGAPLSPRRLNALAYDVGGLADVAQAQLEANGVPVPEPLVVDRAQLVRPEPGGLRAVLLRKLRVAATRATPAGAEVDVELVDAAGTPMAVTGTFAIELRVELGARRRTAPDQPPESVGRFMRGITFAGGPTATLTIAKADADGYREADHLPAVTATLAAAAYPGLGPDQTTVTLP